MSDNFHVDVYVPSFNLVIEVKLGDRHSDKQRKRWEARLLKYPEVEHVIFVEPANKTMAEIKKTLLRELGKLDEGQSTKP
tara:strand:- start:677 stop:916 length:240 start_codon:yes stop_codon:yes gene_type:complete